MGPPLGNWALVTWGIPAGEPNEYRLLRQSGSDPAYHEVALDMIPGDDGGLRQFIWKMPLELACETASYKLKAIDMWGRPAPPETEAISAPITVARWRLVPENARVTADSSHNVTVGWDPMPPCVPGAQSHVITEYILSRSAGTASCSTPYTGSYEELAAHAGPGDTSITFPAPSVTQGSWYKVKAIWSDGPSEFSTPMCISGDGTQQSELRILPTGEDGQGSTEASWKIAQIQDFGDRNEREAIKQHSDLHESPQLSPHRTVGQSSQVNPPVKLFFYHLDHLGTPRVITDVGGQPVSKHKYLPFGEELTPPPSANTHKFTGHERDAESGQDYMFARYYSSSLDRFLSVDRDGANPANPQSWNKYAYALNNPIKFLDSTGRYAQLFLGTFQKQSTPETKAGLNSTARLLQGDGVSTGVTRGPSLLPGSLTRRGTAGMNEANANYDGRLELVGFSRGAIEARDAAAGLNGTRSVDLLLMVDPEFRSNLSVPSNVKLAIHISNGSAKATAQDPSKTTVINLDVPGNTSHGDMDDPNSPQMGFARDAARLADEGKFTPEKAKELAKAYGLRIQK